MPRVVFELVLDRSGIPPSAARLYVDRSGDGQLQEDEEVTLGTSDGKTWIGVIELPSPCGVFFVLKFIAPDKTKWALTASTTKRTLFAAQQQLMGRTKEVLSGFLR